MTQNIFSSYDVISDLAANRPATPTVANGRLCVFMATDTGDMSVWNAAAALWVLLSSQNRFSSNALLGGIGTVSTVVVANGFGSTWKLTPKTTGRVRLRCTFLIKNSGAGDGVLVEAIYGTGTAPVNGGSIAGAIVANSQSIQYTSTTASALSPANTEFEAAGLTIGTAYWFDLGYAAITAGTAFVYTVFVVIEEF